VPGVRYLRKIINGVLVVAAPAEIDTTAAEQLRAVLLDSAARGHITIVVDMTGTVRCDSSGLHT
jgi:anti-anti-sigma regulatory factor